MNKIINKTFRCLASIALPALMGLMHLTSCSDDLLNSPKEYGKNPDGTYGPFDLKITVEAGAADAKTRGNFSEKIILNNVWIGLFDSATGNLVAMATEKDSDSWTGGETDATSDNHQTNIGEGFSVTTVKNLMINDENTKVYIAGVANYGSESNPIMVKTAAGEDATLEDALLDVKTINDLKDIAIDVRSAEDAMNGQNCPVLSGFWGTGHGNVTVDNNGKVVANEKNQTNSFEAQLFDAVDLRIKQKHLDEITNKPIHLRRMYSKIDVTITHEFEEFSDAQIEVYNMPRYAFVQPHTTIQNASDYDPQDWKEVTANAASKFEDGVSTEPFVLKAGATNASNGQEFIMNPGDELSINGKTIKFTYWHYESNHWGLPSVKTMNDREKMYAGSKVYSSLSPKADDPYNDDAPYFVIKGKIKAKDKGTTYEGEASWTIHEGFCCKPDGDEGTDIGVISRDFSTFRNTQYFYTINLLGINSIVTKVSSTDLDGEGYAGADGDLWSVTDKRVNVAENGATYKIDIPDGKIFWCIKEKKEGESSVYYGKELTDQDLLARIGDAYPSGTIITSDFEDYDFYRNIVLEKDGQIYSLGEIAEGGTYNVTFKGFNEHRGLLYIFSEEESKDGLTKLHTLYSFSQGPLKLDTPKLSMPYAKASGELVMGIDDHTISWPKVEDAESYTIKLEEVGTLGGYTVTLRPGEIYNDASSTIDVVPVYLVDKGDRYEFRMRYSNRAKALLNLVQESTGITNTATISVVANAGDYHSDKATISRTIVNPIWDFNTSDWQNAVKNVIGTNSGTFPENVDFTVHGLNVYTGNSTKLVYQKYGNYYAFSPGGTGSQTSRGFRFKAISMGKINVWTSSKGSAGTGQRVGWTLIDSDGIAHTTELADFDANKVGSGTITNKSPDMSFTLPSQNVDFNIFVFAKADLPVYKVQFTPQDIQ